MNNQDRKTSNRPVVKIQDLGKIPYQKAWNYQTELQQKAVRTKSANRKLANPGEAAPIGNYLLLCEHPHVYTLGKSGSVDHLLLNEQELADRDIEYFKINRGGDITYHGPGQIVAYPIFDLEQFFTDAHRYVRSLEGAVIATLAEYGIEATRIKGYTGVWLEGQPNRKICAIGVHLSRWVSLHGLAFNVNTDLGLFNNIIPCGINDDDKTVTSMQAELGHPVDMEVVKSKLLVHFSRIFEFEYDMIETVTV